MDRTPATMVDARGHRCPTPTLKLQKALRQAAPGDEITLLADDPLARIDVPHFVQQQGHALVSAEPDGTGFAFVVRKRADAGR